MFAADSVNVIKSQWLHQGNDRQMKALKNNFHFYQIQWSKKWINIGRDECNLAPERKHTYNTESY